MERKTYLELCQAASIARARFCETRERLTDDLLVLYDGIKYQPRGYMLSFDGEGKPIHTVLLVNPDTNYLMWADMNRVFSCKEEE